MQIKVPLVVLVGMAALIASLMALWGWNEAWDARAIAKSEKDAKEALEARITGMQHRLRAVESNYATAELRLSQAYAGAPARRTPQPVVDELCKRGNCAPVDALQAPSD